jgi:hypothetical protein
MTTVHCINLPKREDRRNAFSHQSAIQGFDTRFWNGVYDKKSPKRGICKAHKQIISFAKEERLSSIIVAEDDCRFTDMGAFDYYIQNIPQDYDLYLGMVYVAQVENGVVKNGMSGSHTLYTVHERFYDFYLSAPDDVHIDRYLGSFAWHKKYVVCSPMVCTQTNGSYSDNLKCKVNYDKYHQGMNLFRSGE